MKITVFWANPEKIGKHLAKFSKNLILAIIILQKNILKNQQTIQQFWRKNLRLENAKRCNFRLWIPKWCKGVHCVDLGESFPTSIYLQNLVSIQPRTSPTKTIPDTPIPTPPPPLKPTLESNRCTSTVYKLLVCWNLHSATRDLFSSPDGPMGSRPKAS